MYICVQKLMLGEVPYKLMKLCKLVLMTWLTKLSIVADYVNRIEQTCLKKKNRKRIDQQIM